MTSKENVLVTRIVKPFGDRGAHVVLPFKWIGKEIRVEIVDTITQEPLEILNVTAK